MKKIKVTNIETLHQERNRLKQLCKENEQSLNQKLNYIQDNLGIIALETIIPINRKDKNNISSKLDIFHDILGSIIPSIADKIKNLFG